MEMFACATCSWNVLDYLLMHVESIKVKMISRLFQFLDSVEWRAIATISNES